ncbi:MAG TPA: retron system putative HNH endonuclease [Pirellulales bacterium]|jgi:uncharacterized protein (TIGR02646 family)|nr:retron system putative HNH endonuclease [Pirellulales bacterium]
MRQIDSMPEPAALTKWKARARNDVNFGYALMPNDVRNVVRQTLLAAQRGLCAYTGLSVDEESSHIEHMLPQVHGEPGDDVRLSNLVACYPASGAGYVAFGAVFKGNWPPLTEQYLFVSPRTPRCEERFAFDLRGHVSAASHDDQAATTTIAKLGLNATGLVSRRASAIEATLASLDLKGAKKRLERLRDGELGSGRLEPFCFALKQALGRHIQRLESIKEAKAKAKK